MGSKKKVLLDIRNKDRISNLQDDILTHILSFLPTKYSVRTRVLSKRWKQVFTLVPILDFTLYCDCIPQCECKCDSDTARSFIEFVSWVFNSYHVDKMDTFRFRARVALPESSKMHYWISESLRRGVRVLDVLEMSHYPQKLPLPCAVFTCKTLTVLKISGNFDVEVPDDVCLPLVKAIHVLISVDICSANRLFQSCPVLENLYIWLKSKDNQVLNISIPTLKSLKMRVWGSFELVLDVPNVEYVDLDGDLPNKISMVQGLKLLNRASISVCDSCDDKYEAIENLFSMICHIPRLCFSAYILKAFQTHGRSPPTFQNLVHLEISVDLSSFDSELLINFLDRTPHLEVLVVLNDWDVDETDEEGLLLPENVPACVSQHLKQVEYSAFFLDYECKLVEYLLKNGKVLESIKVWSGGFLGKYLQFNEILHNFPKYSKTCQVELKLMKPKHQCVF